MNHQKLYVEIITRALNREKIKNQYYENHHIVMKSLGGSNDKSNKVYLTGREHFICHWLYYKFQPCSQTACAWHNMCADNSTQITTPWDDVSHTRYSMNDANNSDNETSDFVWVHISIDAPANADTSASYTGTLFIYTRASTADYQE